MTLQEKKILNLNLEDKIFFDFEYEKQIAESNSLINKHIETIFLLANKKFALISSSIVREIIKNGGNINEFVPIDINISEP